MPCPFDQGVRRFGDIDDVGRRDRAVHEHRHLAAGLDAGHQRAEASPPSAPPGGCAEQALDPQHVRPGAASRANHSPSSFDAA